MAPTRPSALLISPASIESSTNWSTGEPPMLVKIFHQHGKNSTSADSATAYLLAEAPQRYLAGMRDGRGQIRTPRPEVIKGDPSTCRRLINSLGSKQRNVYTSGVLSFKELIDSATEREI